MNNVEVTIRLGTMADLLGISKTLAHALDWRGSDGWNSPEELIESTGHDFLLAG